MSHAAKRFTKAEIERAARIYRTNRAAGEALGIAAETFVKLCRQYGIETPHARHRRLRQTATGAKQTCSGSKASLR